MSIFKQDNKRVVHIQPHIKEFIIERMQKGEAPIKIQANVKRQFGIDVSMMFVARTRKQYMKLTGEHLKSYREFHGITAHKRKK